jgi:hypothetical protein
VTRPRGGTGRAVTARGHAAGDGPLFLTFAGGPGYLFDTVTVTITG